MGAPVAMTTDVTATIDDLLSGGPIYVNTGANINYDLPDAAEDLATPIWNVGTFTLTIRKPGPTALITLAAGAFCIVRTYVDTSGVPQYFVQSAYTPTNVTTDRSYDANATTVDELADVLGTLITDLRAQGIVA